MESRSRVQTQICLSGQQYGSSKSVMHFFHTKHSSENECSPPFLNADKQHQSRLPGQNLVQHLASETELELSRNEIGKRRIQGAKLTECSAAQQRETQGITQQLKSEFRQRVEDLSCPLKNIARTVSLTSFPDMKNEFEEMSKCQSDDHILTRRHLSEAFEQKILLQSQLEDAQDEICDLHFLLDTMVPKSQFDALQHRVRELECESEQMRSSLVERNSQKQNAFKDQNEHGDDMYRMQVHPLKEQTQKMVPKEELLFAKKELERILKLQKTMLPACEKKKLESQLSAYMEENKDLRTRLASMIDKTILEQSEEKRYRLTQELLMVESDLASVRSELFSSEAELRDLKLRMQNLIQKSELEAGQSESDLFRIQSLSLQEARCGLFAFHQTEKREAELETAQQGRDGMVTKAEFDILQAQVHEYETTIQALNTKMKTVVDIDQFNIALREKSRAEQIVEGMCPKPLLEALEIEIKSKECEIINMMKDIEKVEIRFKRLIVESQSSKNSSSNHIGNGKSQRIGQGCCDALNEIAGLLEHNVMQLKVIYQQTSQDVERLQSLINGMVSNLDHRSICQELDGVRNDLHALQSEYQKRQKELQSMITKEDLHTIYVQICKILQTEHVRIECEFETTEFKNDAMNSLSGSIAGQTTLRKILDKLVNLHSVISTMIPRRVHEDLLEQMDQKQVEVNELRLHIASIVLNFNEILQDVPNQLDLCICEVQRLDSKNHRDHFQKQLEEARRVTEEHSVEYANFESSIENIIPSKDNQQKQHLLNQSTVEMVPFSQHNKLLNAMHSMEIDNQRLEKLASVFERDFSDARGDILRLRGLMENMRPKGQLEELKEEVRLKDKSLVQLQMSTIPTEQYQTLLDKFHELFKKHEGLVEHQKSTVRLEEFQSAQLRISELEKQMATMVNPESVSVMEEEIRRGKEEIIKMTEVMKELFDHQRLKNQTLLEQNQQLLADLECCVPASDVERTLQQVSEISDRMLKLECSVSGMVSQAKYAKARQEAACTALELQRLQSLLQEMAPKSALIEAESLSKLHEMNIITLQERMAHMVPKDELHRSECRATALLVDLDSRVPKAQFEEISGICALKEREIVQLRADMESSVSKICLAEAQTQLERYLHENASLKSEIEGSVPVHVLNKAQDEAATLKQLISSMVPKSQADDLRSALERSCAETDRVRTEFDRSRSDTESLKNEINRLNTDVERQKYDKELARNELQQVRAMIAKLEAQKDHLRNAATGMVRRAELSAAEERLAQCSRDAEDLRQQLRDMCSKTDVDDLRAELSRVRGDAAKSKAEVARLTDTLKDMQRSAAAFVSEEKLLAAQSEARTHRAEVDRLMKLLEASVARESRAKEQGDRLAVDVARLEERLRVMVPREELIVCQTEIAALRQQTDAAGELAALHEWDREEIERLKRSASGMVSSVQLAEAIARAEHAEENLRETREKMRNLTLEEELNSVKRELAQFQAEMELMVPLSALKSLEEELERLKCSTTEDVKAREREVAAAKEEAERLTQENARTRARLKDMVNWTMEKTNNDMIVTQAEIDGLLDEVRRLEYQLQGSVPKEDVEVLSNELAQLKRVQERMIRRAKAETDLHAENVVLRERLAAAEKRLCNTVSLTEHAATLDEVCHLTEKLELAKSRLESTQASRPGRRCEDRQPSKKGCNAKPCNEKIQPISEQVPHRTFQNANLGVAEISAFEWASRVSGSNEVDSLTAEIAILRKMIDGMVLRQHYEVATEDARRAKSELHQALSELEAHRMHCCCTSIGPKISTAKDYWQELTETSPTARRAARGGPDGSTIVVSGQTSQGASAHQKSARDFQWRVKSATVVCTDLATLPSQTVSTHRRKVEPPVWCCGEADTSLCEALSAAAPFGSVEWLRQRSVEAAIT